MSKLETIKQEKKEKTMNERIIRQFNLKMFEKVVNELKEAYLPTGESDEDQDAKRLGEFLFNAKGIDKQMAGYYFGEDKKFNTKVCREFLNCFNFKNLPVDSCWRLIFNKCGLPKEGQ
jgi:Sec7-like guanine-nucleotide exchange factor